MQAIFQQFQEAINSTQSGSYTSFLFALILAYLGGIASSLTPCIYPMVPITVSYIGGTSKRSLKSGWILSSSYVLGMATIYTILGIVASLSGKIFGSFTNSWRWNLGLGIVMVFSSLWMLDAIQFDPAVLLARAKNALFGIKANTKLNTSDREEASIRGAFFLGISSGFIAAPCTTPVLTAILGFVAQSQSVFRGGALMFSFALGLGTILVLVGTFAGALKLLPKSGHWMTIIKKLSGLLMTALGLYFVFKAGSLQ